VRKLGAVIGLFLLVITFVVAYNARATLRQRDQTLVVNVAARQPALAERYIKDVLLTVHGDRADPSADAAILQHTASALLHGGEVRAVQGADEDIRIPTVSTDWRVLAKLTQEKRLIDDLVRTGTRVMGMRPDSSGYTDQLEHLRVLGALVTTTSNDAVGQMTLDAQRSLSGVVRLGVVLGVLGAIAALAMGLLLRRAGQRQTARFQSLVHNSSDVLTVLDGRGLVRYESPAGERTLGTRRADVVGARFLDLVHPEDATVIARGLEEVKGAGASLDLDYRRRAAHGEWRDMESVATNLLDEPMVRGVVLNSRDVTERKRAERALETLQSERGRLLDRTVRATEQERKRLATELHDGPVQHLAALTLKLERLGLVLDRPGSADPAGMVDEIRTRLQQEVEGLRRVMSELRPPILDEQGLVAALRDHLNAVRRHSGLECTVDATVDARLDPTQEVVLYRVAQEALTNVAKHARATHAWVSLHVLDGLAELEIRDDGVGFDPTTIADLARDGHFGLIGMRERLELAGGHWELQSTPGGGTVIRALLPQTVGQDVPAGRGDDGDQDPVGSGRFSSGIDEQGGQPGHGHDPRWAGGGRRVG